MSILSISSSMVMDSGNYTCSLGNSTLSDTVDVSVVPGDMIQQLRPGYTSDTHLVHHAATAVILIIVTLLG